MSDLAYVISLHEKVRQLRFEEKRTSAYGNMRHECFVPWIMPAPAEVKTAA
jgi:hypothetical protein